MVSTEQALAQAEHQCQQQGARFTAARRRVLAILLDQSQPQTAYQILDLLRAEQPGAQPPTVYRALDFLLRHALVHRIESTNSYLACNSPHSHDDDAGHHWPQFLLCDVCGDTREVPLAGELRQALARQANAYGFRIGQRPLEVHGLCPRCQSSQ